MNRVVHALRRLRGSSGKEGRERKEGSGETKDEVASTQARLQLHHSAAMGG